ncbi:MAG: ABC transporter ATP-binding protein [Chloroflexota bacterium]|nr:ABC transporter ATP-binding protein [Chloroflexota bacterium]
MTAMTPRPAIEPKPDSDLLLDVKDLKTYFHVMDGTVKAVDGVNFSIPRGKTLGVVGESGCGKSVTALTIMGLLDIPPAEVASGSMHFDGRDLLTMEEDEWRQLRGSEMAMIFQEPMTSLNPVFRVGDQISESVLHHMDVSKGEANERAIAALRRVGIAFPERRARQYPHELSGGMRQRVMIAMALACEPKLIIADEPTTALDVTIQAQILELIRETQEETGAALMLITHDLGVVAEMVDEVIVMYAGRVVEHGTAEEVLLDPKHPYSEGLLASIPSRASRGQRLNIIKGAVPNPFNMPGGCNFAPRCPYRFDACDEHDPRLKPLDGRQVACWKYQDVPS